MALQKLVKLPALFLTIPATSMSVEWSVSALKRVNTYPMQQAGTEETP
jgi:hypothetical protein